MEQQSGSASFFARFVTTVLAVILVSYLLPGVNIDGVGTAIIFAIVLGLLNMLVKPLLILFTLPITMLTLGLFLFIINALMVLLTAEIVPGFEIEGFWWAFLFSVVLSLTVSLLHGIRNVFSR